MSVIYIACPPNLFTGGPTLLHQLCSELRKQGLDARMLYTEKGAPDPLTGSPLHPRYEHFQNPFMYKRDPGPSDVLIVPETETDYAARISCSLKIIWWLSVDNYLIGKRGLFAKATAKLGRKSQYLFPRDFSRASSDPLFKDRKILHAYQSEYAARFLVNVGIPAARMFSLSDYLDDRFIGASLKSQAASRQNIALFNPKKNSALVRDAIKKTGDAFRWTALEDYSEDELIQVMQTAKVYVDFGGHPGKDRLPREAAMCGCCIITGRRGSAKNDIDIPIPSQFKLDEHLTSPERLLALIEKTMEDYDDNRCAFELYRAKIAGEYEAFRQEVCMLASVISEKVNGKKTPVLL